MQRTSFRALLGKIERDSLLQRLEELVKGIPGRETAGQLRNNRPVAAVLDMDTRG